MGQVMMVQFQEARTLATTLNANFMKERRVQARRARRRNSYINFKKLIAKNIDKLYLSALSLIIGVISGFALALYSRTYIPQLDAFLDRFMSVEPVKHPPLAVIQSPSIDLPPVAASGDETVISLKLSTNLSLTNPSLGENQ
jgi:hypothetical protein